VVLPGHNQFSNICKEFGLATFALPPSHHPHYQPPTAAKGAP